MTSRDDLEIFLVATPGLEDALLDEVRSLGFASARPEAGGITVRGKWADVWRLNLQCRGATRVLVRIGSFHAVHLAQLDKRARQFPWGATLRRDVPVKVEVTCRRSRIYHSGAARQRIESAITQTLGAPLSDDAEVQVKVRIEDDLCTISVDSSGDSLHRRGHKEAVGKAPMRETLASLFLRQCGYRGGEPVVDPMCGSGTFVIEAAEIAAHLSPGRDRRFAFQHLAGFDAKAWQKLCGAESPVVPEVRFFGSDRDAGAITMSTENAARAGVAEWTTFRRHAVSDLVAPEGPPGLVIVNPPFGARIGDRKPLFGLYGALGKTLIARFGGWRVGLVTTDQSLAKATGLPFGPPGKSVLHGGLRISLFQTGPLPPPASHS